ncbi:MAG: hypothetical protein ACXWQO_06650 [Bdellovibrionota bacterium]
MKFPTMILALTLISLSVGINARAEDKTLEGAAWGATGGTAVAGTIIFTGALLGTKRMPKNEASLMGVGFVGGAIGGASAGYMLSDSSEAPEAKALEQKEEASDNQ